MTPARTALILDGTATPPRRGRRLVAGGVVLTFWTRFRNATDEGSHDIVVRTSFTDETGGSLPYDEVPLTLIGRSDRVAPRGGFVTVARCTLPALASPRLLRHSVALEGRSDRGRSIAHRAGLEVLVDAGRTPIVRFTPMIAPATHDKG